VEGEAGGASVGQRNTLKATVGALFLVEFEPGDDGLEDVLGVDLL